jgi:hypothetical protein
MTEQIVPSETVLTMAGTRFRVCSWRPGYAHAEQYRTVETAGEYLLESVSGGWRYWADGRKVETAYRYVGKA